MRYLEIFWVFLKLGCTSFGGPIAHLLYFRNVFVTQRAWLNEAEYANILTLCQALPGPASSQVGFIIGLKRAGLLGAIAAFIAFTLPSVVLLVVFAEFLYAFESGMGVAALQGLMILAFTVVLHGVLGMGKNLCFDRQRFFIALATFIVVLLFSGVLVQVCAIFVGGLYGYYALVSADDSVGDPRVVSKGKAPSYRFTAIIFVLLLALFFILPFISSVANEFFRSGALVFGGGHVVLPLLEESMVASGLVSQEDFLAGYGATQALPGPIFSFAAYLGFIQTTDGGIQGALTAVLFIFLPGLMLVYAFYPIWRELIQNRTFQGLIAGANAAVVGLLAAALYDPIFIHAINDTHDVVIAALAYSLLSRFNIPVVWVVLGCVAMKCALVLEPSSYL